MRPATRAALASIIFGLASNSCGTRPTPCLSPEACPRNQTCTTGRCGAIGAEIAPADARRLLVAPSDMAIVSSRGGDGALPPEMALGGATSGSIVVLFRFPTPWGNRVRVASAFLTLEPSPGALPEQGPVALTVVRVLEPWSASDVTWGRLPRLSAPEVRAYATAGPPKTLRIDVTSIVQRWARGRVNDQGIALMSAPDATVGATYATGVAGARGPRLDVYLR
jgi:hypothetical protein